MEQNKRITRNKDCPNCNRKTTHRELGKLPAIVINEDKPYKHSFWRADMCLECGALSSGKVSKGDINDADNKIIAVMYEEDLISKERALDMMGSELELGRALGKWA